MAIGNIYRTRVLCVHATNHLAFNIMYWRVRSEAGLGASLAEIATALDNTWAAPYKAVMSANAQYRGVGVQRVWTLPASAEVAGAGNIGVGGVAGDLLQYQAGLIKKTSLLAGRANQGRIYIPFPSEADNAASGIPSAGYTTNLGLLAAAIDITQTIVGAAGNVVLDQVIWHRSTPGTTTTVDNLIAQTLWATQRRRSTRGKILVPPW